jgi:hypothetical protein
MRVFGGRGWRVLPVMLLLLFGTVGCGSKLYPVRGKVTFADGSPVTEGMVVFESVDKEPALAARGQIQADGTFELSTHQAGDGAPAGKYRVLVAPKYDANAVDKKPRQPAPFDVRYTDFKTSRLEFEVTASGPNDFAIYVAKPDKAR